MLVFTALAALWCLAVNRPGHFGQLVVPWVIYGLASGPLVPVTLGTNKCLQKYLHMDILTLEQNHTHTRTYHAITQPIDAQSYTQLIWKQTNKRTNTPFSIGLAAEMTYPIPADNSAALLFTGAITVFFFSTIVLTGSYSHEVRLWSCIQAHP